MISNQNTYTFFEYSIKTQTIGNQLKKIHLTFNTLTYMRNSILLITILSLASKAFSNTNRLDTLYTLESTQPIIGIFDINYNKGTVSIFNEARKKMGKVYFNQIFRLDCNDGVSYIRRDWDKKSLLLTQLIDGEYGLLHNQGTGNYYIEVNDSLKIITRKYIKTALSLIFSEKLLESFHKESNLRINFTRQYLMKLVHFANRNSKIVEHEHKNNIANLRIKFFVGPYIGYAHGTTLFRDIRLDPMSNQYNRSVLYKHNAVPFGFRTKTELSKRLDFEVASYLNAATITDLHGYNTKSFEGFYIWAIQAPAKFKYPVSLKNYTFTTLNFDLSVQYFLRLKRLSKFQASIFLGPSVVFMMNRKVKVYTQRVDDNEIGGYYNFHLSGPRKRDIMAGGNGGMSLDYKIGDRLLASISARFQIGSFSKIQTSRLDDLTVAPNGDAPYGSAHSPHFDQPVKQMQIAASALFNPWK